MVIYDGLTRLNICAMVKLHGNYVGYGHPTIIWLVVYQPLSKIWVRHLGWLFPYILWKNKIHVPNHQPDDKFSVKHISQWKEISHILWKNKTCLKPPTRCVSHIFLWFSHGFPRWLVRERTNKSGECMFFASPNRILSTQTGDCYVNEKGLSFYLRLVWFQGGFFLYWKQWGFKYCSVNFPVSQFWNHPCNCGVYIIFAHTDPRNNHTKIMTWIEWNHFCHGPRVTQWPPWSSRFCSEFLFSQRFFSSEHIRTVCPIVIPV